MACLDEETIAAFVESRGPPDAISRVESHVQTCELCFQLVSLALSAAEHPLFDVAPEVAPGAAPSPRGTSIGRYTVLGLLGRGGMGEVYAAYDPELDRKIALKILHAKGDPDDDRSKSRLLREAKATARLRHPHVVVVHDAGTIDGRVFLTMEYIDGQTLAVWLERPHSRQEILELYRAAGEGLGAAHAAGLVHRDFKPHNVMVRRDGGVRVMDFGLARAIDGEGESDPEAADATSVIASGDLPLTRTGELVGTPLYMAPEQLNGGRVDARSDQFSFCVALYQALYGVHPFPRHSFAALMAAVVEGHVEAPPPKSIVPSWLRRVLLRGLSARPDDRFASMSELLAALGRDPARRRRRWIAAGAVALLVLGAALGTRHLLLGQRIVCDSGPRRAATAWAPAQREAIARAFAASGNGHATQALAGAAALLDDYVARWTGMYRETCEATHLRGEQSVEVLDLRMSCLDERLASVRALTDVLASADRNVVGNAVQAAAALPPLDRCTDVPLLRSVVKPPENASVRRQVTSLRERITKVSALASAGLCVPSQRVGRPIEEGARKIGYLPLQAEIAFALGSAFDSCGDIQEQVANLEDAFMYAAASRHDEIAIEAAALLGTAYSDRLHNVAAGRQWIRLAESVLTQFPGHPLLEARVDVGWGIVLLREGRYEEALRTGQKALAIQERLLGPSTIDVAMSANNAAMILHELGRDAEAEATIHRAVEIFSRVMGEDSGRVAGASLNEAEILTSLGRFADAEADLARSLRIWRQESAGSFLVGYALLDRGRLQLAEGAADAAIPTLEESLRLMGSQDSRSVAEGEFALAQALVASKPADRARAVTLAHHARVLLADDDSSSRLIRQIAGWQERQPAR